MHTLNRWFTLRKLAYVLCRIEFRYKDSTSDGMHLIRVSPDLSEFAEIYGKVLDGEGVDYNKILLHDALDRIVGHEPGCTSGSFAQEIQGEAGLAFTSARAHRQNCAGCNASGV